jgi:plastocyanin
MDSDPACSALHAEAVLSDALVVDAESRVRWAFIRVRSGLEGRTFAAPADSVILAQEGCRYEPHVLGIQVGQPLVIVNQDPLLHNVHALTFVNGGFNIGQPTRGLETTKTFTAPEIIPVRCDVHPWMSAWIGVVDHPYFAVTDAAGKYSLPALPPGTYRIEAWQEACEPVSKEIDVTSGAGLDLDFVLDVRK